MTRDSFLPRHGATYVAFVIFAGYSVILLSGVDVTRQMLGRDGLNFTGQWLTLAALTLLSGSATVRLPSVPATISISETFVFTSVILFGATAGSTIVALDGLIISVWLAKRRKEFYRVAFNMAAPALSIWFAATIYYAFPSVHALGVKALPPVPADHTDTVQLLPLVIFTLCHFLINSWLIAFAVGFETRRRAFDIWRNEFLWLSLNYFGGASVAALLSVYSRNVDWTYCGIIIPLLLILYFTFKIPMARVEDTNLHLKKVNSLYLSTIETLALAIDAKDQVTHGHIRRVQTYTVGLAKALGIRDDLMLRAIEASALLHDMGKLAIPEHILNKPGKLTPAEFEKMKMHASIGADILSSIEFPYPVVPIVRHHHENWDGTGYPTGLAGTAIPIGARILSVVDCFDALTSDRPYRPALTTQAALDILIERRGKMYDPLVVDTFVRIHSELITNAASEAHPVATTKVDPEVEIGTHVTAATTTQSTDGLALFHLYQVLTDFSDRGWQEAADLVVYRLSQVMPVSRCAVFAYDPTTDGIVCQSAHGLGMANLRGVRRRLGEGLSGWVAANRKAVVNSIPALDLAEHCPEAADEVNSTLSVPLALRDNLVGVLSIYATAEQAFSEHHTQIAESIAPHIAGLLRRSRTFSLPAESPLAGYPGAAHLDRYVRQRLSAREQQPLALVVIQFAADVPESMEGARLAELADFATRKLRGGDLIFACGPETLVCMLASADAASARRVSERLMSAANDSGHGEQYRSAVLTAPGDGSTLAQLLQSASLHFTPVPEPGHEAPLNP
jgi:putative nucleotidyltransferase with HDIG domain